MYKIYYCKYLRCFGITNTNWTYWKRYDNGSLIYAIYKWFRWVFNQECL